MRFYEFVSHDQLYKVKDIVNQLWNKLGIDVKFGTHFIDRINDPRNKKEITPQELAELLIKEYKAYGKTIADMNPESEAVLVDILSQLNIPIVIKPVNDMNRQKTVLAKTIMRKADYKSKDHQFKV